ncbi:MAG: nicotinate-nucleotide adenylyltransferase [Candidatus Margulisbacteria bacterium]|nr:nicotinate-nucleotide adenylyltransferase [Candidatus Margulisiibacteriota bacterium]
MKRIGIMGGTFNPIHKGHLALAKAALREFGLNKVVFIPSGNPPHKAGDKVLDKEHRFKMVKLAIKKIKKFITSKIEINRKGYSYAVDTFGDLRKKYGKRAKLFYIMGLDSINEILDWKKPLELFKMTEFIVGTRPGSKVRTFRRLLKFPPLEKEMDKIHLMELNENISASEIRERLKKGQGIARFIPRVVSKYIKENKLYQ